MIYSFLFQSKFFIKVLHYLFVLMVLSIIMCNCFIFIYIIFISSLCSLQDHRRYIDIIVCILNKEEIFSCIKGVYDGLDMQFALTRMQLPKLASSTKVMGNDEKTDRNNSGLIRASRFHLHHVFGRERGI